MGTGINLGLQAPDLQNCSKEVLLAYFEHTWLLYEWLFSSINSDKDFYTSPDPLRNPLIFYYGHTAAFYVNKLKLAGLIPTGIDPHFDHLFAVGVDPADPDELEKAQPWPAMNVLRSYRQQAKDLIVDFLQTHAFPNQILPAHPEWAFLMGLEHDRIHFETSSVLIRQLSADLLTRPKAWHYAPSNLGKTPAVWQSIAGGKVRIGLGNSPKIFAWDNEFGALNVEVKPFLVRNAQVTNEEFLEFVDAGGYEERQWWSASAWNWLQNQSRRAPRFWLKVGPAYRYRAMFDEVEMPLDWPVEVNCFEAAAFCKWAGEGARLITEAEWRFLADDAMQRQDPAVPNEAYNLHLKFGSPNPVSLSQKQGSLGIVDIFGNVWDWISNDFYPLPGFQPHAYYKEFSEPYFDEDHGMMLGGAWATTGTGASNSYRLWFRHSFMQHAGFRLAKSKA